MTTYIKPTIASRKVLRSHAREAMRCYSPVMTWLLLDNNGDLYELVEAQGQTEYVGSEKVIATTGGFYKAHGNGAVTNKYGQPYKTQKAYLIDLLGKSEYERIFLPTRL